MMDGVNLPQGEPTFMDEIAAMLIRFPAISRHVSRFATTAEILTNPGIEDLTSLYNRDTDFLYETISFLDTLSLMDITRPNGSRSIIAAMLHSIAISRSSSLGSQMFKDRVLQREIRDDFDTVVNALDPDTKKLIDFLDENRPVLGFYIYCLVAAMYGLDTVKQPTTIVDQFNQ